MLRQLTSRAAPLLVLLLAVAGIVAILQPLLRAAAHHRGQAQPCLGHMCSLANAIMTYTDDYDGPLSADIAPSPSARLQPDPKRPSFVP